MKVSLKLSLDIFLHVVVLVLRPMSEDLMEEREEGEAQNFVDNHIEFTISERRSYIANDY
ncbi:hypothetical protein M413DRAFT_440676 [Hebeloma cylindrosporum]|uniref:Uncharacterized protein n=1 Tax=Hebeloma cylindrosporum TaxID=76867 RepID=A0A0C3CEH6_HEBCY|nr:hypothetical protein M413DRAFT_440676 [Hebeloma cylindrosporum h7]